MNAEKGLALLLLGLATACASGGAAGSSSSAEPALQVQAAALEHVFYNNDSPLDTSAGAYCIGIGTGLLHSDPPPSLLRTLQNENPRVTRLSNCGRVASRTARWQVIETLSHEPALAFLVEEPSFQDDDTARVYVEYIQDPTYATGYDCRLERSAEGWEFQRCNAGFPR
jgi:hypothetical protein